MGLSLLCAQCSPVYSCRQCRVSCDTAGGVSEQAGSGISTGLAAQDVPARSELPCPPRAQLQENRIVPNSHFILQLSAVSRAETFEQVLDFTCTTSSKILGVGLVVSLNLQMETLVMIPRILGSLTCSGWACTSTVTKSIRQEHMNLKGFKTTFASCKWKCHSRPWEILGAPKAPMLEMGTWLNHFADELN